MWHSHASAQEKLSLSVTPPLFQLNSTPGEVWKSSIKVVNSNAYSITVYANIYGFAPKGEDGQGDFIVRTAREAGDVGDLADWIEMTKEPLIIAPEQSMDVPITVSLPQNAPPGGHFAAILIGTRPPEKTGTSVVRTSQVVTSLFFMRVAGDIKEAGSVREFSVPHSFHNDPESDFVLRFQNNGNVQLQPQGGITIFNMWGKERGFVPINQKSHFGNVLPKSIRRFDFSWHGESSLADIGRYTAEVTLTYGEEGRQNTSSKVYFWVVPLKATFITLLSVGLFVLFCVWIIRGYVRRVVYLSGFTSSDLAETKRRSVAKKVHTKDLSGPLREGVLDLRNRVNSRDEDTGLWSSLFEYMRQYYLFFFGCLILLLFIGMGVFYFSDVLQGQKSYQITIPQSGRSMTLSSEEIARERALQSATSSKP